MTQMVEEHAPAGTEFLFSGIDHPSIACAQVERLAEWYCQNLGLKVIASNGQSPPALLLGYAPGLDGQAVIEMMPAVDPGPAPSEFKRFAPGLRHLAFRVRDFDLACRRLKEAGARFTTEPGEALGGGRTVLFRDPEGNELQIVQRSLS